MSTQSRPLLGDGGAWIFNAIKRNPEGLLLLAAGAVLMMRTNSPQSSQAASIDATYGPAKDAASKTASQMGDAVTDIARRTMDAASSYASTASDTARQTMDAAKSYASSAVEYADQAKRVVGEQSDRVVRQTRSVAQGVLQNQPLAIVAAGLAAGAALAAAFPPTELEKETLGPMGDQVSKAAERFGDQLKQATSKAGEKLKTAAEERGLHTEGLKDVAGEVVDAFKASMTGQAEQTNDRGPAPRPDSVDRSR
jgi:flagellar hook-basal body complex protein FliE